MLYMFFAAGTARTGPGVMAVGGPSADAANSPGLALPLARCEIAMGVTMGYLLIQML